MEAPHQSPLAWETEEDGSSRGNKEHIRASHGYSVHAALQSQEVSRLLYVNLPRTPNPRAVFPDS
jgi:hypothetical protein